jgi:hypothetical protein
MSSCLAGKDKKRTKNLQTVELRTEMYPKVSGLSRNETTTINTR